MAVTETRKAAAEVMEPMLAELNRAVEIEQTLAALALGQDYERQVSKTETYMEVRVAPKASDQRPPKDDLTSDAPIEIWVYPQSKRPALADALIRWRQASEALGRLMPQVPRPPVPLEDKLKITPIEDWDVVQVYPDLPPLAMPGQEP
jgi:hypothetical protein